MAARDSYHNDGLQFEGEDKGLSTFGIRERGKAVPTQATEESLLRALEPMMAAMRSARHLPESPDELEIQMGLKLTGDDFIITRGQNDANLIVTMKWRRG